MVHIPTSPADIDVLEQLEANIESWPQFLPRRAMVPIAAGTVTQAHNEIERLREESARRCDGCKHWNLKDDDGAKRFVIAPAGKLGVCTRAMPFWNASEWAGQDVEEASQDAGEWRTVRKLRPEHEGRRFFAQDGSDYRATVLTGADFFCAEFEAKPKGEET
jgi:hypothetical protein